MELMPKVLSTIELNGIEKMFSLNGGWLTIAHSAHLVGNTTLVKKNMFHAVSHLLKRHPKMRSRLRLEGFQRHLDILDYDEDNLNANLFYSIVGDENQSWQKITEDICNRSPYQNHGRLAFPLFHFLLLFNHSSNSTEHQQFHLIIFSNHIVSDGRSGMILINDLLTLLTMDNLSDHIEPVNTQILPCLADLIPKPNRFLFPIIYLIAKRMVKKELRKLPNSQIPTKIEYLENEKTSSKLQPVKSNFLFTSSSSTLYSRLRSKCRSLDLTLHGPLMACLLLSIDRCFPKNKKKKGNGSFDPIKIDVDFDLRSRIPNSSLNKSTVGFCITATGIYLKQRQKLDRKLFWNFAKDCSKETNRSITNGNILLAPHVFKKFSVSQRKLEKLTNRMVEGRLGEINFSNIGKYPHSTVYGKDELKLEGLHVVNNSSIYRVSMVFLVTCVGEEQMDFSISHEIESSAKAQEFLDYFVRLIEKIADSDTNITLQQLLDLVQ